MNRALATAALVLAACLALPGAHAELVGAGIHELHERLRPGGVVTQYCAGTCDPD